MRLSEVMSRCNSFLNITIISSKIFYQFYSITLCIFFLLLIQPAQAIDYTFSDNSSVYPAGCAMDSPGNYTCGAFSFAAGDSVIIGNTKPATMTFNGAVTLGASVYLNAAGAIDNLSVVVNGASCNVSDGSSTVDGLSIILRPLICQIFPSNAVGFDWVVTSQNQLWSYPND